LVTPLRVYTESHGCTANKFDFEILLTHLIKGKTVLIRNAQEADIILVNTCGVKKATEDRILAKLRYYDTLRANLIITGCLPKINFPAITKASPNFSAILDTHSLHHLPEAITGTQKGKKHQIWLSSQPTNKLQNPRLHINPVIEIIPIAEGCLGTCTYCCVRNARGSLVSYPITHLRKRMEHAITDQIQEIWLTSQDTGAYGLDHESNLVELLTKLSQVQGQFWIRVGMMNPNHVYPLLSELIDAFKNPKIFKFIHLPVQSGDNDVLQTMNREYTITEFKHIITHFRRAFPYMSLATDVICGFPGETEQAFEETCSLLRTIKPDVVNISKFFSRPHTPASNMPQLHPQVIKQRSKRMSQLAHHLTFQRNERWRHWEGRALVDEKGQGDSWIARNYAYKPLILQTSSNLMGCFINVRVTNVHSTYLDAQLTTNLA
jgi:MiaB-like tRNA modifying enzyme